LTALWPLEWQEIGKEVEHIFIEDEKGTYLEEA
jgi:hypothetical protein